MEGTEAPCFIEGFSAVQYCGSWCLHHLMYWPSSTAANQCHQAKRCVYRLPPTRQGGRTEIIGTCTTAQLSSTQFKFHLGRILQARYKSGKETLWRRLPKYVERERKEICIEDWERLIGEAIGPSKFPVPSYLKLHSEKGTTTLTPLPRGVKRMQLELKNKVNDKLWNLTDGLCNRVVHSGSW